MRGKREARTEERKWKQKKVGKDADDREDVRREERRGRGKENAH